MSFTDEQLQKVIDEISLSSSSLESEHIKTKETSETEKVGLKKFWWVKQKEPVSSVNSEGETNNVNSLQEFDDLKESDAEYGVEAHGTASHVNDRSPDVSSSMADFLEKERFFKDHSSSTTMKDKDVQGDLNTEVDAMDNSEEDSDEEISSIMEQLSQLTGSADSPDRSVEDILKEAVQLARENSQNFKELGLSVDDDIELDDIQVDNNMLIPELVSPDKISNGKMKKKRVTDEKSLTSGNTSDSSVKDINEVIAEVAQDCISTASAIHSTKDISKKDKVVYFKEDIFKTNFHSNPAFSSSKTNITSEKLKSEKQQNRVSSSRSLQSVNVTSSDISLSENKSQPNHALKKSKTFSFDSSQQQNEGVQIVRPESSQCSSPEENQANVNVSDVSALIQYGNVKGSLEQICKIIDAEVQCEVESALKEKTYSDRLLLSSDSGVLNMNGTSIDNTVLNTGRLPDWMKEQVPDDLKESDLHPKKNTSQIQDVCEKDRKYFLYLNSELVKEKRTSEDLRNELETTRKDHLYQTEIMKKKFEEELFMLQRDNVMLQSKVSDYEEQLKSQKQIDTELSVEFSSRNHRITLLEKELQKQEQLIVGCQKENKKLCFDIKQLKDELKNREAHFNLERQQLQAELIHLKQGQVNESSENKEALLEQLKDKDEFIVQLQLEIESLKDENKRLEDTSHELQVSKSTLLEEIDRCKRNIVLMKDSSRVAATAKSLTILNRELDRCKTEVKDRDSEIITLKRELDLMKNSVEGKKNEITALKSESQLHIDALELRVSEIQQLLEKEKAQNKKNLQQREEDKKKIQDLNRQVKELERILKRNCPNSLSALILSANSEPDGSSTLPRVKYLENHIQQLEQELKTKEKEAFANIRELQDKFQAMKMKYDEHVSHLELELATAKHQANMIKIAAERDHSVGSPVVSSKHEQKDRDHHHHQQQPQSVPKTPRKITHPPAIHAAAPPLNALAVKEDAHLLATIRGLKAELVSKDKEIHRVAKDLEESRKTVRKLQREREKFLHKEGLLGSKSSSTKGSTKEDKQQDTVVTDNSSASTQGNVKHYDPSKFESSSDQELPSLLEQENESLRRDLLHLEEEYRTLKTKRLKDLSLLQEQHEMEIANILNDQTTRNSTVRIAELKNQLSTQKIVISHLKEQLKQLDEYREEILVLKSERDHLEKTAIDLNKKLIALRKVQTPEASHYAALQEKIEELEYRHQLREEKLQVVIRDLIYRNSEQRAQMIEQQKDMNSATLREKLLHKNKQLFHFQTEMDHILKTLKQLERSQRPFSS